MAASFTSLEEEIIACTRCPRLIEHSLLAAETKRRAYVDQDYWGKPVPGFGDPEARLLVIGLAPAAHGGNRTGRTFTGNGSADWLMEALYEYGFSNQPSSTHRNDGLTLHGAYVANTARCAPPANRPTAEELRNCQPFLERELDLLTKLRVVVVLGQVAFNAYWRVAAERRSRPRKNDHGEARQPLARRPKFAHNALYDLDPDEPALLVSYHPSRQNTQTGRLTKRMFHDVFATARSLTDGS